eukprot:TRINITY_DN7405_c0_g1_i1.p1 TRINITY_DN7405_c0_g1~~TRINITY_DN7405_c0_g1_i1.p1  ORF type:complete len:289 (-),score=13.23 TRINITY_DN7405_c0_g1_i1:204-1070(-)
MEPEKRYQQPEPSRTPLYVCIGFLSMALIASLGLSFYTLISFNSFKDNLSLQFQRPTSKIDNSEAALRPRTKRQAEPEPMSTPAPGPRFIGTTEESKQGATYTRWGALGCRRDSAVVYVGETATAYWSSKGGTNYLCVPAGGLEWLGWNQNISAASYLMGVDYQTTLYGDQQLFVNKQLNNANVPCAVCQATQKLTTIMIPGKKTCPDETWRAEYIGYIMTTADTLDNQSEYVCVDVFAEPYPANDGNTGIGGHMVHVKGYCAPGSGDIWGCASNEHNRELACIVCSK